MKHSIFILIITFIVLIASGPTRAQGQRGSMEDFIRHYRIKLIPENMNPRLVMEFSRHLELFPRSLMDEMLQKGAKITLIDGYGVTEDPSFRGSHTHDGRSWSTVPGSGGNPAHGVPTRIVVNRLDYNGSSNLFLHEHGHALNSLYSTKGITNSRAWKDLLARNPGAMEVLDRTCGPYCTTNDDEAFAELFALYYGGQRRMIENYAPGMADFFRNFHSVREFTNGRKEVCLFGKLCF